MSYMTLTGAKRLSEEETRKCVDNDKEMVRLVVENMRADGMKATIFNVLSKLPISVTREKFRLFLFAHPDLAQEIGISIDEEDAEEKRFQEQIPELDAQKLIESQGERYLQAARQILESGKVPTPDLIAEYLSGSEKTKK